MITINQTAAGYNWYVSGQRSSQAFGLAGPDGESLAGPAARRRCVDLLTVLEHELGHVIGLPDNAQAGDLMDITLGLGVSRAPTSADLAAIVPASSTAVPAVATNVGSNGLPAAPVDAALPALMGDNPAGPSGTTLAAASAIGPLPAIDVQPRQPSPLSGPVTQATVDAALASMLSAAGGNSTRSRKQRIN